jgi:hypothetical protein
MRNLDAYQITHLLIEGGMGNTISRFVGIDLVIHMDEKRAYRRSGTLARTRNPQCRLTDK